MWVSRMMHKETCECAICIRPTPPETYYFWVDKSNHLHGDTRKPGRKHIALHKWDNIIIHIKFRDCPKIGIRCVAEAAMRLYTEAVIEHALSPVEKVQFFRGDSV